MADWFIATEGVKVVKDSASLWPQIITAVLPAGAAFGGVWYGQWRITQREKKVAERKRESDRAFIGAQLIVRLRELIYWCDQAVSDIGVPANTRSGQGWVQIPDPAISVTDFVLEDVRGDWSALSPELNLRILEIPLRLTELDRYLSHYQDKMCNPPEHKEYFGERRRCYRGLTTQLDMLCTQLSKECKLPESYL